MTEDNCEKSQTADGDTPHESPNRAGELDVLDKKYSCRCGFIGETAEEVWEHQEEEMQECADSDCSGRMDECDHCPEIATGDAQREPIVFLNDVLELVDQHLIRAQEDKEAVSDREHGDCEFDEIHAVGGLQRIRELQKQLEEVAQKVTTSSGEIRGNNKDLPAL